MTNPDPGVSHLFLDFSRRKLFEHYADRPETLPDGGGVPGADLAERVTDYLAGMTDRYCIREYTDLEVPRVFAR